MSDITTLPLKEIRLDPTLQMRARLDEGKVREYAERIRAGDVFPHVLVFRDPDTAELLLVDGFHRYHAARATQRGEIAAELRTGTRRKALLLAVGLNAAHGLPRTNEDKRRAVNTLLNDPEWSRWSDGEIARRCAVSQPFVSRLREAWRTRKREEDRAAFQATCNAGEDAQPATHNGYELDERLAVRNGKPYAIATGRIGTRSEKNSREGATRASGAAAAGAAAEASAAERIRAAFAAEAVLAAERLPDPVQAGVWWRLGRQHLFCGTATHSFRRWLPPADLALCDARGSADLTPEANAAPPWEHDWLGAQAAVVAVLLRTDELLPFGRRTRLTYHGVLTAAVPDANQAVPGEPFLHAALFRADGATAAPAAIPSFCGAAPPRDGDGVPELVLRLMEQFTPEGGLVADLALGNGVSLLAAEVTGLTCWGAEADPEACRRIIRRWELLTGEEAEPGPVVPAHAV